VIRRSPFRLDRSSKPKGLALGETAGKNAALLILRVASALAFRQRYSFRCLRRSRPSEVFRLHAHVGRCRVSRGTGTGCQGLAILSGALIRLGAACIIVVTLGAIFLVHLPHGFDIGEGRHQIRVDATADSIALLITGAGAYFAGAAAPKTAAEGVTRYPAEPKAAGYQRLNPRDTVVSLCCSPRPIYRATRPIPTPARPWARTVSPGRAALEGAAGGDGTCLSRGRRWSYSAGDRSRRSVLTICWILRRRGCGLACSRVFRCLMWTTPWMIPHHGAVELFLRRQNAANVSARQNTRRST